MNEPAGQLCRYGASSGQHELKKDIRSRSFLEAICSRPLVLDAAMGTRLMALGLDPRSDDASFWNINRAADVLAIHQRDLSAGADAVLTNTFGANRCWLERFGREAIVESVNRAAVAIARTAAGPGRFVIGDIGPTAARANGAAIDQAAILVSAGVDAIILETFEFPEAEQVLREIRTALAPAVPVLASLWKWPANLIAAARRLRDAGADVIGMNCQPGIKAALEFAERLGPHAGCPLLVKPSAGQPSCGDDDSAAFAVAVPRLLEHNVRLFGGCCGTSDAHVAALADACAGASPPIFGSAGGGAS